MSKSVKHIIFGIMIDWKSFKPERGSLLLSEPALADGSFSRAVVLLVAHDENGTIGFILNRKMEVDLKDLGDDFLLFDHALYEGGPVQQDTLHFIHKLGEKIEGAEKIAEGIYWGGNFEQLLELLPDSDPGDVKFFLGYSGWSAGQLDEETELKSWIVTRVKQEDIFPGNNEHMWEDRIRAMGGEIAKLADYPRNLSWN